MQITENDKETKDEFGQYIMTNKNIFERTTRQEEMKIESSAFKF